jgi:hypothetical protein
MAIASVLQIPSKSAIEIDHTIGSQSTQAAFRAKNNDFHLTSSAPVLSIVFSATSSGRIAPGRSPQP